MDTIPDSRVDTYLRTEQAVKTWIEEVLKKPLPVPDSLHLSLKDGIVLCNLMLELDHSSIPHIQCNTSHAFRLKENISFFILACEDYKIPSYKLFTVNDLWEDHSIVAVVDTLEELANVFKGRGFAITLPPLDDSGPPPSSTLTPEKKNHLKLLISKLKRPTLKSKPKRTAGITLMQLEYLARVNGINMDKVIRCFTRLQAVARGRRVRKNIKKYARNQAFRQKLIKEILSTENTYLNGLRLVVKLYLVPLQEMIERPLLTEEQREGVFKNVQEIIESNTKFEAQLKPRVENYFPNQRIGDIFLNNTWFLEVYTPYVQNFDFSVALLSYLTLKNQPFQKFLSEGRERPESMGLDLSSLLITPIQRIPRYNLLLRDLIKYTETESDHPDLPNLREALQQMEETGKEINKRKGDSEGILKLAYLAATIGKLPPTLSLLVPHRRLQRHALHSDAKQALYAFTDLILWVKAKKQLVLADITPSCNLPQPGSAATIPGEELLSCAGAFYFTEIESFSVSQKQQELSLLQGKKPLMKFIFENPAELDEWISILNSHCSASGSGAAMLSKSDSMGKEDPGRKRSSTVGKTLSMKLPGLKPMTNSQPQSLSPRLVTPEPHNEDITPKKKKWLSLKSKSRNLNSRQPVSASLFETNSAFLPTSTSTPDPIISNSSLGTTTATTTTTTTTTTTSSAVTTSSPHLAISDHTTHGDTNGASVSLPGSPSPHMPTSPQPFEDPKKLQRRDSRATNIFSAMFSGSSKKNHIDVPLSNPTNFRHMNLKLNKDENALYVDQVQPFKASTSTSPPNSQEIPSPNVEEPKSLPTIQSCINLTSN